MEVVLHRCTQPFLMDQDKSIFWEVAGGCPCVPPAVPIRQQCCGLASAIALASRGNCGFAASSSQNFHLGSVGKRQSQIFLCSPPFYSFLSMSSVDTLNFCVSSKKQSVY